MLPPELGGEAVQLVLHGFLYLVGAVADVGGVGGGVGAVGGFHFEGASSVPAPVLGRNGR